MATSPVMTYFHPSRPTKLIVDGSKKDGVAPTLTQQDPRTFHYEVIRYDSRVLTPTEKRYSQPEIESLVVLFGNTKNHMYLYGLPQYTVSTDHEPLLPLYNTYKPDMTAHIQSHKLATQGYDFELIYEPGEDNLTDYMSRHPLQQTASPPAADPELHTHVIVREDLPNALPTEKIQAATATDKTLQQLMSAINKGYIPAENKHLLQPYNLVFTELSTTQDIILHGTHGY